MISSDVLDKLMPINTSCSSRLHLPFHSNKNHVLWSSIVFVIVVLIVMVRITWYLVQRFAVEKKKRQRASPSLKTQIRIAR
jgi:nitric oxide reductase large subunit